MHNIYKKVCDFLGIIQISMIIYKVAKLDIFNKKIQVKYYIWLITTPKRSIYHLPYLPYKSRCME